MRPTALKPGDKVITDYGAHVLTFVRRDKSSFRQGINVFQCDAYRGLNGPDDQGFSYAPDSYVVRRMHRAPEASSPTQR